MTQKKDAPERRQALATSALLAATALSAIASACGDDKKSSDPAGSGGKNAGGAGSLGGSKNAGGEGGEGGAGSNDPDVEPLNALLTAEYHAITAYTAGAGLISDAPPTDPLSPLKSVLVAVATSIQAQHRLHAASLVSAITTLGGRPVKEASVASAFKAPADLLANVSISNTLKFAASAERNAAVSYNQVLSGLEDAKLRALATSIEGDETQHFIVLTALVVGLASPGAKLDAKTAASVFPAAFVSSEGKVEGLDSLPPDYFP